MELQILVIQRGASFQLGLWFKVLQSTMRITIQLLHLSSWTTVTKHHMAIHHLHLAFLQYTVHMVCAMVLQRCESQWHPFSTFTSVGFQYHQEQSSVRTVASFTLTTWIESQLCTRTHNSLLTCFTGKDILDAAKVIGLMSTRQLTSRA